MTDTRPVILLVDDKEENLFSLENILMDSDCEIFKALSADEGMKVLREKEVACLLLDVHMPKKNGFEMAQEIRADEGLKDTPIVFVTAVELGSDKVKRGYDLGALDYLIKPLNPNLVRAKVDLYCQLFRKSKEIDALKAAQKR
jgi:DNA-binding response OmpR family regulator